MHHLILRNASHYTGLWISVRVSVLLFQSSYPPPTMASRGIKFLKAESDWKGQTSISRTRFFP